MSPQAKAGNAAQPLDAKQVADYLREHADFFTTETELLAELRIPHECGNAVSLMERQVTVLRDQNHDLKGKLMELVQVARDNDRLNERLHKLGLDMIAADSLERLIDTLNDHLQGELKADTVALRLFGLSDGQARESGAQTIDRNDAALAHFEAFFQSPRPLCGRLKQAQLDYLFCAQAPALESAALVPLGPGAKLGMLAIGSSEASRFHPGMGTLFLTHLGELVGGFLAAYLPKADDGA